jgi:hypothetical protein
MKRKKKANHVKSPKIGKNNAFITTTAREKRKQKTVQYIAGSEIARNKMYQTAN